MYNKLCAFNITKFNNLDVGRREYGLIAPWEQFLKNAPREIVYVKIFDSKSEQEFPVGTQT